MSTRRYFYPSGIGAEPFWIYGNGGGVGNVVAYPDGTMVLQSADLRWSALPNIYLGYGARGVAYATTSATIMPAGAAEAQAMAMYLNPSGTVNSTILGTFISPDSQSGFLTAIGTVGGVAQYAALPTSAAGAQITTNQLICGGFFAYYLQGGVAHTAASVTAIDMTTGVLTTSFTGQVITVNSAYSGLLAPPKVFSDGNALFGVHALGLTLATTYFVSFSTQPAGTGTITVIKHGGTTITAPLASYGATGFNGPFFIAANGSFGSAFSSGQFSLATPAPLGSGLFQQDLLLTRPNADPARTGSLTQTSSIDITGITGSTIHLKVFSTGTGTLTILNFIGEGGSTGVPFNTGFPTSTGTPNCGAAVAAAVAALFPDCSMTYVDSSFFGVLDLVLTLTMPSGATYFPYCFADYQWFGSGPPLPQTTGTAQQYIGLMASDGSNPKYYLLPGKNPSSSAVAVNGSTVCHVFNYVDSNNNVQWVITIPGVIRINVSLAYTLGTTHNGTGTLAGTGDYSGAPVSVIAFGSGFALALPYDPIYTGAPGAPLKYTFSPAVASAATALLNGPIFLLTAAGAVSSAFDTAIQANFFSLGRTDGRRYGPQSLTDDGAGNLLFGSYYAADYFDLAATNPTPTDEFGDLSPAPIAVPLTPPGGGFNVNATPPMVNQQGPGLEVLCCCDDAGGQILPP